MATLAELWDDTPAAKPLPAAPKLTVVPVAPAPAPAPAPAVQAAPPAPQPAPAPVLQAAPAPAPAPPPMATAAPVPTKVTVQEQKVRDQDALPIFTKELARAEAEAAAGKPRAVQDVAAIKREMVRQGLAIPVTAASAPAAAASAPQKGSDVGSLGDLFETTIPANQPGSVVQKPVAMGGFSMAGQPYPPGGDGPIAQAAKKYLGDFGKVIRGAAEVLPAMAGGAVGGVVTPIAQLGHELFSGQAFTQEGKAAAAEFGKKVQGQFYQPRTEEGQQYTAAIGNALAPLIAVPIPTLEALSKATPAAVRAIGDVGRSKSIGGTAVEVPRIEPRMAPEPLDVNLRPVEVTVPTQMSGKMLGEVQAAFEKRQAAAAAARAANPPPAATPTAVTLPAGAAPGAGLGATPGSVGAAALTQEQLRIARARSLPFSMELSKDQATRDPADVRFARETAKDPVFGPDFQSKYAGDNAGLQTNLNLLSEKTGAEKIGIPVSDLAESLIDTVTPYKKTRKTEVSDSYTAARNAGEMAQDVSYKPVIDYINGKIKDRPTILTKNPILGVIFEELKVNDPKGTGKISLNAMEDVRQLLVNEIDPAQNGSVYHGRNLKTAIDKATEQSGGDLYKKARNLNEIYMTEFEDTPVIKNILAMKKGTTQRSVAVENLIDKSLFKGPTSDVKQLFETLEKAGPEGQQMIKELKGYAADQILQESTKNVTLDINGKPYLSTDRLNSIIKKLDKSGKLELFFGKEDAAHYRTINDVTKDLQTVPVGTTNPSGTSAQILATLAEMGLQGATTGVPVPIVTGTKYLYGLNQERVKKNKISEFINYGKNK